MALNKVPGPSGLCYLCELDLPNLQDDKELKRMDGQYGRIQGVPLKGS